MAIATVKKYPSLREQVCASIREAIVQGRLAQGVLVSEQVIADQVGVSRTPVREALLQLAQEGLVEFVRNAGVRIMVPTAEHLAQVYALRACIEAHCARAMAEYGADGPLVAGLREDLDLQRRIVAAADPVAWVEANMDFHRKIVEASGNGLMLEAWDRLRGHIVRAGLRFHAANPGRMVLCLQEHLRIVDGIGQADSAETQDAVEAHLRGTAALLAQTLELPL